MLKFKDSTEEFIGRMCVAITLLAAIVIVVVLVVVPEEKGLPGDTSQLRCYMGDDVVLDYYPVSVTRKADDDGTYDAVMNDDTHVILPKDKCIVTYKNITSEG